MVPYIGTIVSCHEVRVTISLVDARIGEYVRVLRLKFALVFPMWCCVYYLYAISTVSLNMNMVAS